MKTKKGDVKIYKMILKKGLILTIAALFMMSSLTQAAPISSIQQDCLRPIAAAGTETARALKGLNEQATFGEDVKSEILISAPLVFDEDECIPGKPKYQADDEFFIQRALALQDSGIDTLHLDIKTKACVANLLVFGEPNAERFNPALIKSLINAGFKKPIEVHLMDYNTEDSYIRELSEAGAPAVFIYHDSFDKEEDAIKTLELIRELGMESGVVLRLEVGVEEISDEMLRHSGVVVLTATKEGAKGLPFNPIVVEKSKQLLLNRGYQGRVLIQSGINDKTISITASGGAVEFVSGSYIAGFEDYKEAIEILKTKAAEGRIDFLEEAVRCEIPLQRAREILESFHGEFKMIGLGAGDSPWLALALGDTGWVLKVPELNRNKDWVERVVRAVDERIPSRMAKTSVPVHEIKINVSRLDRNARYWLMESIDPGFSLERDWSARLARERKPIIDRDGNITIKWAILQEGLTRLVLDDNTIEGAIKDAYHAGGEEAAKRVIDDYLDCLNELYQNGICPNETKLSGFGKNREGRVVLMEDHVSIHNRGKEFILPALRTMFTVGLIRDISNELAEYFLSSCERWPFRLPPSTAEGLGIITANPLPPHKVLHPSGLPTFAYEGETYSVQPRIIPASIKGGRQVIHEEELVALALAGGWKVVLTENYDTMTYASLYVITRLMEMAEDEFALGLATGGTTESLRKAMGLVELCKQILNGLFVQADKINKISTLDDYYWPKEYAESDVIETSAYRNEQLYMFLRNLYGGDIPDEFFISPPIDTELSLEQAAEKFRKDMEIFLDATYRILVQIHGIGASGHDAFNEIFERLQRTLGRVVYEIPKLIEIPYYALTPHDYDEYRNMPLLRPDHATPVLDITRIQNIGHLIKRGFHRFFLRFMADNLIFDMPELIGILQTMTPKEIISYYKENKYQFYSEEEFLEGLEYLLHHYNITPGLAITQGTGDILRRTKGIAIRKTNTPSLNLFMVSSPRKAEPFRRSIEEAPSAWATASSLQLASNALVIASLDAALKIDKSKCFYFEPENREGAALAIEENIEKAWQATFEGKRITTLIQERDKESTEPSLRSPVIHLRKLHNVELAASTAA